LPIPDLYTVLYGIQIPVRDGQALGDTCFTNTSAAYDDLSSSEKAVLIGKRAIHSLAHHIIKKREANFRPPPTDTPNPAAEEVSHPVVRIHPRTGKPCLYVTEGHTKAIQGLSQTESDDILRRLFKHIVQDKYIYRHKWRAGDLLIWDNCSTQHLAVNDYGDMPRRLHRSGITGDIPVGLS
jgi:taurine dioxygenase